MNGAKYRQILENLLQSAKDVRLQHRFMFQQDNNRKHPAKATMEWRQNKNVKVLVWSSESPDLNPIESLWKDLKIAVHRHSPSNMAELEQICKEEWEKIPKSRCAKLTQTYPRRREAVIAAKGSSAKY